MNSFSQLKERCNKHCGNCFYEELNANEEPCLSCSIPKRFDNWKPREPDILNVDDMAVKLITMDKRGGFKMNRADMDDFIKLCRGNFRRERDQELKAVIEDIKKLHDWAFDQHGMQSYFYTKLHEILENIPPLEE